MKQYGHFLFLLTLFGNLALATLIIASITNAVSIIQYFYTASYINAIGVARMFFFVFGFIFLALLAIGSSVYFNVEVGNFNEFLIFMNQKFKKFPEYEIVFILLYITIIIIWLYSTSLYIQNFRIILPFTVN